MELLERVGLAEFADRTTVELPYGRKRALEIATTLALDPKLMLLDEPTAGMGHEDVDRVTQLIKKVAADRTVLMVEHNMNVVSSICDTITVLQRGEVLAEGPYAEVSKNPQVLEAYMGSAEHAWRALVSAVPASARTCCACRACTPGTANRTSCTASTSRVHARRGGDAARPQRRRAHHDAEGDPRARRPAHRLDHGRTASRPSACRRTASRAWASATAPRSAASSPASRARRT